MPGIESLRVQITTAVKGKTTFVFSFYQGEVVCFINWVNGQFPPAIYVDVTPNASAEAQGQLADTFDSLQVVIPVMDRISLPEGNPPTVGSRSVSLGFGMPGLLHLPGGEIYEYVPSYAFTSRGRGTITNTNPRPEVEEYARTDINDPGPDWGVYILTYTVTLTPVPYTPVPDPPPPAV